MTIAVIGTGFIGGTLGRAFAGAAVIGDCLRVLRGDTRVETALTVTPHGVIPHAVTPHAVTPHAVTDQTVTDQT